MKRRPQSRKVIFAAVAVSLGAAAAVGLFFLLVEVGLINGAPLLELESYLSNAGAPHKKRRVLVIGDSFLERWPFRHHLKASMERYAASADFGAYVSADRGTGPVEYLARMKQLMPKIRPNLVIVFYYVGNDLTDVLKAPDGDRGGPPPKAPAVVENEAARFPVKTAPAEKQIKMSSEEIEAAFDWDAMRSRGISRDLIEMAKRRIKTPNSVDFALVNPHVLVFALLFPESLEENLLINTPQAQAAWKKTDKILQEMVALAKTRGAKMALVAIPGMAQVDPYFHELYRKARFKIDGRMLASTEPQRRLRDFCGKHGVQFLDLLPHFKGLPGRRGLYFKYDDHFTEEGHKQAFGLVKRHLLGRW